MKKIICEDVMTGLQEIESESIQCVVTSPPYFGLRDYGVSGQIGLEKTPEEFIYKIVEIFREVRRVLRNDGTVWINMGDSYSSNPGNGRGGGSTIQGAKPHLSGSRPIGMKPKQLLGIPWRVALALQADGWYLRQDIIWHKPNPMPESVRDRCTKAHEYVFMLTKQPRYYYDADAIRTPKKGQDAITFRGGCYINGSKNNSEMGKRKDRGNKIPAGWHQGTRSEGSAPRDRRNKQRGHSRPHDGFNDRWDQMTRDEQISKGANRRDVWTIATQPFKEAHFATFPEVLAERCILAGSRRGDVILDPFVGSGTTCVSAIRNGRGCIGIELNPEYARMALERMSHVQQRIV